MLEHYRSSLHADLRTAEQRLGVSDDDDWRTLEPDMLEIRAIASILQDVYRGAEQMFQRLAKDLDGEVPQGEAWHQELLDQVSRPRAQARPAVISDETRALLDRYRAFRHRQRNIYGFELEWPLMQDLARDAHTVIEAVATDVESFIQMLEAFDEPEPDAS